MKRKMPIIAGTLLAAALLLLAGRLLLPEEETPPTFRVLNDEKSDSYQRYSVTRGDLELWANISCNFLCLNQELFSFQEGGRKFGEVYVELGDTVEPGQLLAELENDALDDELRAAKSQAEKAEWEWELARENLQNAYYYGLPYEQTERYEIAAERAEESSRIAALRLDELQSKKDSECIYAGINGTVTYILTSSETSAGAPVMVVSDLSNACFSAITEYYGSFTPGTEVSLKTDEGLIPAVASDGSELGFDTKGEILADRNKKRVFFVPKSSTAMLNETSTAQLLLLLDSRENVLTVPEQAVFLAGDQSFVYMENENGLRVAHPIETGLLASGQYEVLSGLTEGQEIIGG